MNRPAATELLLAVAWESHLGGERLMVPAEQAASFSCWDYWYVCYGLRHSPSRLFTADFPARLRELRDGEESADAVWRLIAEVPVRWPEPEAACPGLLTWRQGQRLHAGAGLSLPAGVHCPVLVKPGVDVGPVVSALAPGWRIEQREDWLLSPKDVRRLYPTAYGHEFIGRVADYMTSGPCTLLLASSRRPVPNLDEYKAHLRKQLRTTGNLKNAIHLPASLGELYTNLRQFFGQAAVQEAYNEHYGTRYERRAALYRTVLGAGPGALDAHG